MLMPYRALQGLQDWSGFPVCSDFPTYLALCTEWFVTRALVMKQTDLTVSKAIVYSRVQLRGKAVFSSAKYLAQIPVLVQ